MIVRHEPLEHPEGRQGCARYVIVTEHIETLLARSTVVQNCLPCLSLCAVPAKRVVARRCGRAGITRNGPRGYRRTGGKAECVSRAAAREKVRGTKGVVAVVE